MHTSLSVRVMAALLAVGCVVSLLPASVQAATVATFSDPTEGMEPPPPVPPLLEINLAQDRIYSRWTDDNEGLTLEVPWTGDVYDNAFFTLTDGDNPAIEGVEYTGEASGGTTGVGQLEFFEDGETPGVDDPLVRVDFAHAKLTEDNLFGTNQFPFDPPHGVAITVWVDGVPVTLTEQAVFSFSFGTKQDLSPPSDGWTATASFTSSAVPEPGMVALLLGGGMPLVLRRRNRRG